MSTIAAYWKYLASIVFICSYVLRDTLIYICIPNRPSFFCIRLNIKYRRYTCKVLSVVNNIGNVCIEAHTSKSSLLIWFYMLI